MNYEIFEQQESFYRSQIHSWKNFYKYIDKTDEAIESMPKNVMVIKSKGRIINY